MMENAALVMTARRLAEALSAGSVRPPLAHSILHELRSSLDKHRYTQRLVTSAERVLIMEQKVIALR